jgi:hypothetical protein
MGVFHSTIPHLRMGARFYEQADIEMQLPADCVPVSGCRKQSVGSWHKGNCDPYHHSWSAAACSGEVKCHANKTDCHCCYSCHCHTTKGEQRPSTEPHEAPAAAYNDTATDRRRTGRAKSGCPAWHCGCQRRSGVFSRSDCCQWQSSRWLPYTG